MQGEVKQRADGSNTDEWERQMIDESQRVMDGWLRDRQEVRRPRRKEKHPFIGQVYISSS